MASNTPPNSARSSLLKQQESFKNALKKQPIIVPQRNPIHISSSSSISSSPHIPSSPSISTFSSFQKSPDHNFASSASSSSYISNLQLNSGKHLNSYIHDIVTELKKSDHPLTIRTIKQKTNIDISQIPELYDILIHNERIIHHPSISSRDLESFEYRSKYKIKKKDDLLNLLLELPKYHGLPIADLLKDHTVDIKELEKFIEELAGKNDIFVFYNKDKSSKIIFYNYYNEVNPMDSEFTTIWDSIPLPFEDDIERELDKMGVKSMEVFKSDTPIAPKTKKRKAATNKRLKLTNVHLDNIDLTKDYEGPSSQSK